MQRNAAEGAKRRAATEAARWIRDGMVLGLGTGSTVRYLLDHIAERRADGEWQGIVGVPTSRDTAARATALGIPLSTLDENPRMDLTIDGADEVDPQLRVVKGLGGALLREKIVASCSDAFVIVADSSKRVGRLGTHVPLPVEVDPFGAPAQTAFLATLGGTAALRRREDGGTFVTDGGNWILDCRFPDGISDPHQLAAALQARPGILEHGLFLDMVSAVVLVEGEHVDVLCRDAGSGR